MQSIALPIKRPSVTDRGQLSCDELFRRSAAHDDLAFKILFNRYYASLCKEAVQVIKCRASAEEIVGDVFTSIWKRGENSRVHTNARYYLKRAVRNRSIDYLRRQLRGGRTVPLPDFNTLATDDTPQQRMETAEMSARIDLAIDGLPPRGRQVFLMSRQQGLSYKKIAQRLGLSIKTVETHMRRALIQLRIDFPEVN